MRGHHRPGEDPIDPDENVEAVHDRLAQLGGELLVKVVADIAAGTAKRTPQDHSQATLAPMLSRALSSIDWSRSAKEIHNQVRGLTPGPPPPPIFWGTPSRCSPWRNRGSRPERLPAL